MTLASATFRAIVFLINVPAVKMPSLEEMASFLKLFT
jgi:hypothetical protein